MSRVSNIESIVRLKLNQVNKSNIQTSEIYTVLNFMQTYLMLETKCLERSFTISTVKDQEAYDISSEQVGQITFLMNSWKGKIEIVSNIEYPEYEEISASYPSIMTIFNRSIYLRPIPTEVNTITLFGKQTSVRTDASASNEPEVPKYCDLALIYGICKELAGESTIDPSSKRTFYEEFIDQKDLIIRTCNLKHSQHNTRRVW